MNNKLLSNVYGVCCLPKIVMCKRMRVVSICMETGVLGDTWEISIMDLTSLGWTICNAMDLRKTLVIVNTAAGANTTADDINTCQFLVIRTVMNLVRLLVSDFAYYDRCYRSVLCLSEAFLHCVQTAKTSTRFLLPVSPPCSSQIALKFGLHRSTPSFPNFAPNVNDPSSVDLSVGDIQWQIAAEWLEIA